jgi:tetratricopeptide (TPR) repeat protein
MKKFYYVFTVALMLLAGATTASAQDAEANEDLESVIADNFKGLNYDVPALDPEIQATCDELMNLMLTDPAKANKDFSKLMRKNRTKPEVLVAMGHYFVMSSKPGMSYFPFANQCQRQAYTAAPTDIRVLMFCAETAMLSRNYGVAGTKFDEILTLDSTYVEAYKQSARVYKMINPYSAIEKLNKLKQFDSSYYLADKELGDIYYMQNQFKDAVEAYDKYYKAVPKTAEDLEIRACIRYCLFGVTIQDRNHIFSGNHLVW